MSHQQPPAIFILKKNYYKTGLIGRSVWEIVPVDNLQLRLQESLKTGARHYVPKQTLTVGLYVKSGQDAPVYILAICDRTNPDVFIPWNQPLTPRLALLDANNVQKIERSINLTVNPLTNPEGGVRGGLVVLQDIMKYVKITDKSQANI